MNVEIEVFPDGDGHCAWIAIYRMLPPGKSGHWRDRVQAQWISDSQNPTAWQWKLVPVPDSYAGQPV